MAALRTLCHFAVKIHGRHFFGHNQGMVVPLPGQYHVRRSNFVGVSFRRADAFTADAGGLWGRISFPSRLIFFSLKIRALRAIVKPFIRNNQYNLIKKPAKWSAASSTLVARLTGLAARHPANLRQF
jgi:hypothetical protein